MTHQEDLRASQVLAVWVGHIESEDALVEYLGKPFEDDFGFVLDIDALPEFTYSFESRANPPDLSKNSLRACEVPFDRDVKVERLLSGFSNISRAKAPAVKACRSQGIKTATIAIAFPNLRYRPELCRNPKAALRFIGNFPWPEGKDLWDAAEGDRLVRPPFPKLTREKFSWRGFVKLDAWKGFAKTSDGEFKLNVEFALASAVAPTEEQTQAFRHLIKNQRVIRDSVLKAVLDVYPKWRKQYYGERISSDGGKTWQKGWDLPKLFPPENMPELSTPDGLRGLIRLGTVHVMSTPKNGFTRIGFSFRCQWDEEHGLGVSTHKGKVIKVGQAEESFSDF